MKHKRHITLTRHTFIRTPGRKQVGGTRMMAKRKRKVIRYRHNHAKPSASIRDHYAPSLFGRYAVIVMLVRDLCQEQNNQVAHACKSLGAGSHKLVHGPGCWLRSGRRLDDYEDNRPIHQIRLVSEDSLMMLRLCIPTLIWRIKRVTATKAG